MKKVRFGIVGISGMGGVHARGIVQSRSREFSLTAVADVLEDKAAGIGEELGVPWFGSAQAMYDSGLCDAVIVATPHYWHAPLTIRAARAGLHVLCEKPLAPTVGVARAMVRECRKRKVAMGVMLQQRTRGDMKKIKQMIDAGRIGEVFRVQLFCSNWFRTQAYYDQGQWRGTWDGEGGGVLINQAPHNLDLFQWIGGMPKRVMAVLATRAHKIEVEDTANIIFEYDKGKIGYMYATTAEEPGCEQLMICGDKGTLIVEGGRVRLARLRIPVTRHIAGSRDPFNGAAEQKVDWRDVSAPKAAASHLSVIRAMARHIRTGSPLVATGAEGLNELELSNAAYLSGFLNKPIDLPVDEGQIERLLSRLERQRSTGRGGRLRQAAKRDLNGLLRKT